MSFNPDVEVRDGIVTLKGVVDNLRAKTSAGDDARNTVGVWQVNNLLKVRPGDNVSDSELKQRIRETVESDPLVDKYDLTFTVNDGTVEIRGLLDSRFVRDHCEKIISTIKGVVDIENYVKIERPVEYSADWQIQHTISNRLFWNPYIESENINVTVEDGIALLTGTVDTWKEYGLAIREARKADPEKVRSRLFVLNGPDALLPGEELK
jgi:osmotically-inducible protein OsmY